jgi:hydrogenase nickel incorporation protein HypB
MCTTCGCGNTSYLSIAKPGEKPMNIDPMKLHLLDDHKHTHGHGHSSSHQQNRIIELEKDILGSNNLIAERNRTYFKAKNITAFNLVSSPGSGKTSLLVRTLTDLGTQIKFSVIEGDQQTMQDANRISATQIPVIQINTGQACHLDSDMVDKALQALMPPEESILFIENVGNLVCPAMFDLGEETRVVVISVTEGDDKPLKYPDMFSTAQLCLINKIDLLDYVDFSIEKVKENALKINHHLKFMELSATKGTGMEQWYDFLKNTLHKPV